MGKFFQKKPEKCSICGQEKLIFKDLRQGLTHFKYCKECYDDYYKKIESRVTVQVQEAVKSGRMIGMKEALDITKQITAEVEAENLAKSINNELNIVICSGYFDPMHEGHLEYLQLAKKLYEKTKLIVIINNHNQAIFKNGKEMIPEKTRIELIKALKFVDEVVLSIDTDLTVCKSLEKERNYYPIEMNVVFAKGGDRLVGNIPEKEICDKLNIKIVDGLGAKINSSSSIKEQFLGEDKSCLN